MSDGTYAFLVLVSATVFSLVFGWGLFTMIAWWGSVAFRPDNDALDRWKPRHGIKLMVVGLLGNLATALPGSRT